MTQKTPWHEDEAVRKKYGLDEIMKQQAMPVEKPIWYEEWMRNPLESGYEPNVFDTLRSRGALKTTNEIYDALVLLEGGILGLLERQILVSWWDYRLWTLVAQLKSGLDNVRKKIGEERFFKINQMLDELVEIFVADPDGERKKPGEWVAMVDEISDLVTKRS